MTLDPHINIPDIISWEYRCSTNRRERDVLIVWRVYTLYHRTRQTLRQEKNCFNFLLNTGLKKEEEKSPLCPPRPYIHPSSLIDPAAYNLPRGGVVLSHNSIVSPPEVIALPQGGGKPEPRGVPPPPPTI